MTSCWFDPSSTSKTLNLSLLRFNERSDYKNLANNNCMDKVWSPSPNYMESWSKKFNTMNFVKELDLDELSNGLIGVKKQSDTNKSYYDQRTFRSRRLEFYL